MEIECSEIQIEDRMQQVQNVKCINLMNKHSINLKQMVQKSIFINNLIANNQRKNSISDLLMNKKVSFRFLRYLWQEIGIIYIIFGGLMYCIVVLNQQIRVNCQTKDINRIYYCQENHDKTITKLRGIIFYDIGLLHFIYHLCKDFQKKSFILLDLLLFATFIIYLFFLISYDMQQLYLYLILWLGLIAYVILYFVFYKASFIQKIQLIIHQFLFLHLLLAYYIIITENIFQMQTRLQIIIANIYMIMVKMIIISYFQQKYKNKYKLADLRFMILILYIQDISLMFNQIVKKDIDDLYLLYLNFIVMMVYNLTQFHLWVYLLQEFITKLLKIFCSQKLHNYFNTKLQFLVDLFFERFQDFLSKISNPLVEEENKSNQEISRFDILRVLSSYQFISYMLVFTNLGFMMIFQTYIPYEYAHTYNLNQKPDLEQKIQDNSKINLTLQKYILTLGIFLFTFICIFIYGHKKKMKFFAMFKLNYSSLLSQLLFLLYILSLIQSYVQT